VKRVGTWYLPDREEHLADWILKHGNYQGPHRANALSHVTKWGVAVDIGAHVGLWSREFCEKFGHVHAFEPMEEHRACYVANIDHTNYTLHPCALGDKEGAVKMTTVGHSTGGTHVDPKEPGDTPVRTLDSFNLSPDFIKMDCEAYELFVLKGARETLLRCKPIVCLEQKNQGYFGHPRYAASEYLRSLGAKALSNFKDDWVFGWPVDLHQ
jgi:FkbM family methyltransferase